VKLRRSRALSLRERSPSPDVASVKRSAVAVLVAIAALVGACGGRVDVGSDVIWTAELETGD